MPRTKKEDSIGVLAEQMQKARALLHKKMKTEKNLSPEGKKILEATTAAVDAYNSCVDRNAENWAKRKELG